MFDNARKVSCVKLWRSLCSIVCEEIEINEKQDKMQVEFTIGRQC